MDVFPEVLADPANQRQPAFRAALFALRAPTLDEHGAERLVAIYLASKQLDIRKRILHLLYDLTYPVLQAFFAQAWRKERYLDMKVQALRGLAPWIDEAEMARLLAGFRATLAKREQSTPYNYQEYELLRGACALPYLVERYGYACLVETLEQLERQYQAMPDAFKGHFSVDAAGEIVSLRTPGESSAMIRAFFDRAASGQPD
ncbi:MAG: hypothetical protein GAK43_00718 [Stenotrophomonas maltophilia]|nr:MAG: hypothetical protein GAK43_00718 [Stenotrophomonas maltophilia]